jgi:hypothetical protein
VEVRVWESKLASFGFMEVKFWLQNLHAQFTERGVPVIFSSMVYPACDVIKNSVN